MSANSGDSLSRTDASEAVEHLGWRYILGTLMTSVPVGSLAEASVVALSAVQACGDHADRHLRADLRCDRVELSLQDRLRADVTVRDVELAVQITETLAAGGHQTLGAAARDAFRGIQMMEIAIDALDIPRIRPFWKAVLGYTDEAEATGPTDPIIDPVGQLPAIWFQQMDEPRIQRNRLHLDITVGHDAAEARIAAALAAGGRLVSSARARSFWILADAEGNEVCVCTWLDRDERSP